MRFHTTQHTAYFLMRGRGRHGQEQDNMDYQVWPGELGRHCSTAERKVSKPKQKRSGAGVVLVGSRWF